MLGAPIEGTLSGVPLLSPVTWPDCKENAEAWLL
jgi:hypothetical protein